MVKVETLELLERFSGSPKWILGDTSLCFQSIFCGLEAAPFMILLNFEKIGHFKKCGQP